VAVAKTIKRTAKQQADERRAIAKYVKLLKADKRADWEVITDDESYDLILKAPLDQDRSAYAEYGWGTGAFRYLVESYAEAGPFIPRGKRGDDDPRPYREIGLDRGKVLSKKQWEKKRDHNLVETVVEYWHWYDDATPDQKYNALPHIKAYCKRMTKGSKARSVRAMQKACAMRVEEEEAAFKAQRAAYAQTLAEEQKFDAAMAALDERDEGQ
jgi:hypothetical protein